MTDLLLKLCLLVWPFGHFLDARVGEGLTIPLLDILSSALLAFSTPGILKEKNKLKKDPLTVPIIVFLGISAISLIIRIPELGIAGIFRPSLYLFRLVLYFSLYFVFKTRDLKKYSEYLKLTIALFVGFALTQYILSPNMSFIKYIGFDDHYYRLIGTLLDPNFTGALISSLSLLLVSLGLLRWGILLLIPLGLTFSRASYVSFFLPLLYFSIRKNKYLYLLVTAFLALIILLSPKPFGEGVNLYRTFSIYSRLGSSQQGLNLFLDRPLLGWGYNTLVTDTGRVGIDNSYIFLLATTGVAGLLSFLLILWTFFKSKPLPAGLAVGSVLIHALFNNTIFLPWILVYLVFLMAKD